MEMNKKLEKNQTNTDKLLQLTKNKFWTSKLIKQQHFAANSVPKYRLLITFANCLYPDQDQHNDGPRFCKSWSGSKLFAKVISRCQKLPLARKELRSYVGDEI